METTNGAKLSETDIRTNKQNGQPLNQTKTKTEVLNK